MKRIFGSHLRPLIVLVVKFVQSKINQLIDRLVTWAKKETARRLSDIDDVPEVTLRSMVSVVIRSLPFMRPMLVHILVIFGMGFLLTFIFTFAGTVADDMWTNKMLVNDKLQPVQSAVLLVDDSYLKTEFLTEEEAEQVEAAGYSGDELTPDQRKTIRNRMLVWFFIGDVFGILLLGFYSYYPAWVWQNVSHYLRVTMVERLEYLSLSFHNTNRAGDAIYRIYQDSSMVVNVLQEVVISPIEDMRYLIIAFFFLLAFDPLLLGVVLLSFIPMIYLTAKATPIIRRLSVANRVLNSDLTSRTQETFAAIKVFKANTAEALAKERFDVDSTKALDAALYVRFSMIVLSVLVGIVGGLTVIGLEYLLITWTLIEKETAMPGWAFAFVGYQVWNLAAYQRANGYIGGATGSARGFVRMWCMWQDLFIGLERAFYFLDLKPSVVDPEEPSSFPERVNTVTWDDVSYQYEDDKPVLKNVNLQANAGEITAIVGNTGSGKSTLLSLLLRIYDPDQGEVRVNDISLPNFMIEDLRSKVAIALQKNILFSGSIRENISFGYQDATLDQVVAAAQIACAHDFIMELEDGYETELGERGAKLSAGQRQRITLARAVIRNTPILILDEPTASLDAKTEQEVIRNLSAWGEDKLIFLITHRLATIRNADRIAFLSDGHIAELGSHDELMQLEDGLYRIFVGADQLEDSA